MNNDASNCMHKINDFVMHRQNGVCQITDIRKEDFCGTGEETYYIMRAVNDASSKIYVPINSAQIRDILTKDQINEVVKKTESYSEEWIDDSRLRATHFEQILRGGKSSDILWLIKVLSLHKSDVESQNKKFYASDEKILDAAKKIILQEFSFVLGLNEDEVIPYIINLTEK